MVQACLAMGGPARAWAGCRLCDKKVALVEQARRRGDALGCLCAHLQSMLPCRRHAAYTRGACAQLAYLGLYDVALDESQVRCGALLAAADRARPRTDRG